MSPPKLSVRRTARDFPAPTPQLTPCLIWQGPLYRNGYGVKSGGGSRYSHRWVMETAIGRTLEPNEHVLHKCDNRACFRFDHLELGTHASNMADMAAKGRAGSVSLAGERNGRARLTEDDVREMRRRHAVGETQRSLAAAFDMTNQNVNWIVTGRTWRNVDADA